jgi:predicted transcriptional regulator
MAMLSNNRIFYFFLASMLFFSVLVITPFSFLPPEVELKDPTVTEDISTETGSDGQIMTETNTLSQQELTRLEFETSLYSQTSAETEIYHDQTRSGSTRAKIDIGIHKVGYYGRIKELGWYAAGEVEEETLIFVDIKNYGTDPVNNVAVDWKISDYFGHETQSDSKSISSLDPDENITVDFVWIPKYSNLYNVTFDISVNGDENLTNNNLEWGYISAAKWTDNFESEALDGWTGDLSNSKWHITDSVQNDPNSSHHSSPNALYHGQELGEEWGDEYSIDEDYVVTTPELDLRRFNSSYKAFLFYLFYGSSTSDKDELTIEVRKSPGEEFSEIDYVLPLSGNTKSGLTNKLEWQVYYSGPPNTTLPGIPINLYLGEIVQFRFHWRSDLVFEEKTGFYLDDFILYGIEDPPPDADIAVEDVNSMTIDDNIWNMGVAGEQVTVMAKIKNRGAQDVGPFNVNILITDLTGREENTMDSQTRQISNLGSNEMLELSWTFIPSVSGIYYVNVSTDLDGDEVNNNNFDDSLSFKVAKYYFNSHDNTLPQDDKLNWQTDPENGWYITTVRNDPDPKAHTPSKAWYFGNAYRNYEPDQELILFTPIIDLEGVMIDPDYPYYQVQANFKWHGSTSMNDRLYFEYSMDENEDWQLVQTQSEGNQFNSTISGSYMDKWYYWQTDIGSNEFAGHHVQFRLRFKSDEIADTENIGFYIDDFVVWVLQEEYGRPKVSEAVAEPELVLNDGVEPTILSVNVTNTVDSASVKIQSVMIDLSPLGGSSTSNMVDDGSSENGDELGNDGIYSIIITVTNETEPGFKKLVITATATNGKQDTGYLFLQIRTNQAPEILGILPAELDINIFENETQTFKVIARDLDPDDELLVYKWTLNGITVLEGFENNIYNFSSKFKGNYSEGIYYLNLTVSDDGYPPLSDQIEWTIHVINVPPDFEVTQDDIDFSRSMITVNDTVWINVTIHNVADPEEKNITVLVIQQSSLAHAGDRIIKNETIDTIPGNGYVVLSINWVADKDADWIKVLIDPDELIFEMNETNNEAIKPIDVAAEPEPEIEDPVESPINDTGDEIIDLTLIVASTSITIIIIFVFVGAGTEFGTYKLVSLFIPLYSRVSGKKILDHDLRNRIYNEIKMNPGIHYRYIMSRLKLKNGTLVHHLMRLEQEELIKSERDGVYKRFYPIGLRIPKSEVGQFFPDGTRTYNIGEHQVSEIQMNIIDIIRERPGLTQKEIAKRINESRRVVNYHIKLLIQHNIVFLEKVGRETRCYINDEVS